MGVLLHLLAGWVSTCILAAFSCEVGEFLSTMEGDGVSPHAGASSSSKRKKRAPDAHRESAANAKVERGRVKRQHRQNTLVYYASSRNRENASPLETARNVPHPISAIGSDGSNDTVPASAAPPQPAVAPVGNSDAVAASPAESSDARHGGVPSCIIISSSSDDGGAETPTDLQEVSLPDTDEDFDEDGESLNPKKKPKKTMI